MASSEFKTLLCEELDRAADWFAPGELAYLALTSKPEGHLRDRLAFALHQRLSPQLVISREHPVRTDLAAFDASTGRLVMALEATALYTCNALVPMNLEWNRKKVARDIAKAQAIDGSAAVFALALVTHPHDIPDDSGCGAIKYVGQLASAIRRYGAEDLRTRADQILRATFGDIAPLSTGSIRSGEAFGVEVEVLFYLLCPVPSTRASRFRHRLWE
jgi:hypothetical protein